MSEICYAEEAELSAAEFIGVLRSSGLAARRPVEDGERIERMLRHADVIVTARREGVLIGVARAITDYSYCCYLSDVAVDERYQRQGIGRKLIEQVRGLAGAGAKLILLAAPAAASYYPGIGMRAHPSCWVAE